MDTPVAIEQRAALLVVSQRRSVRLSEIGTVLSIAFGEIYRDPRVAAVPPAGPPFVVYHGVPEDDQPFEIEICAPIPTEVEVPSGWEVRTLPAGTFATLVHVGPYDRIATAYAALGSWIATHDYVIVGPPREVYLSRPDVPAAQIQTRIEYPLEPASVLVG